MKKTALTLCLTLMVGLVSKTALAVPVLPDPNGTGMLTVVGLGVLALIDSGHSAPKGDAKLPSTQSDEFAALNSMTESLGLMDQSAGGSADLKALLK